nr:transposase, MuDR [Tanacetum cinerariifolium]
MHRTEGSGNRGSKRMNADVEINEHEGNEEREDSEHGFDSEQGSDSEDSEFIIDKENMIHDVELDMLECRSNTDVNVEWVGCKEPIEEVNEVFEDEENIDHEEFDSATDSDNEGVRKKALRKLAKLNKAIGKRTFT